MTRARKLGLIFAVAILAAGCAAGKAFRQGEASMRAGSLDEAVVAYRRAVQAAPDNANYRIALERASLAASRAHLDRAREFESHDQLEAALGEYRLAAEYDPSNRLAVSKIAELERTIRDRIEASRPRPPIQAMRERARAASAEPILNPGSREPIRMNFNNVSLREILTSISNAAGINVSYDRDVQDRQATIQLDGVTLEQALNQIMAMNQLSYKVLSERSIFIFQDIATKHAQYDEQVVRTFYVSHADATELVQLLSIIIRLPGIAVQPAIAANKTNNTITVRATSSVVQILEKIIQQNDKPRAEVVFDIEILEVDRQRAKSYGINLSEYSLGAIFSPETSPNPVTAQPGTVTGATAGQSTAPSAVRSPSAFNLNTVSRGVSTADFYLAVPTAIVRFLESDTRTKLVAKPQLRGAEGAKLTLNLGDEVPVVTTSYTPIATGGAAVNPLNSFQLKPVGINIDITPRVTLDGDILIDLNVESSTLGPQINIAGTNYPSFGSRKVSSRLRLRDGEANLLAGLLRDDESKSVSGFPGGIHLPFLRQVFSGNEDKASQTDIVMLLTPHIVRTSEISEDDLKPIYIGSQQNLGVGGPPPLINIPQQFEAAPAPPTAPASAPRAPNAAPGATPSGQVVVPGGSVLSAPPGSAPVPGTVLTPQPPTPAQPNIVTPPEPAATPPPGTSPPIFAQPPPPTVSPSTAVIGTAPPSPSPATPTTTQGLGSAMVILTPPGPTFRIGAGPYTVPVSIVDATRVSGITLTLIYDSAKLRVRSVQEGSFMRAGGATVAFNQQVTGNRIDITIVRGADVTGATGTGLLTAILFEAIAPGPAELSLSGTATGPGGTPMGLRFMPVTVTVQ